MVPAPESTPSVKDPWSSEAAHTHVNGIEPPGCWLVTGESAGLGLGESEHRVTDDGSRFVPHLMG